MIRKLVSVWAVVWVFSSHGQSQAPGPTLAINDLVAQALERNRDLLAARQRVGEAQGLLRQAGVRLAPTVESEVASGRPLGTHGEEEYTAAVFYPFETGGKRQRRLTVAEFGLPLAEAEVAERTRQLSFEIKRRAVEALAARRKQAAVERLLNLSRDSYQITKTRVDEGDAAPLEQQLLATELARIEVQQASFAGRAAAALLDLRQAVGSPDGNAFVLRDEANSPGSDLSLEQLKAAALAGRPDLRAARLLEQQAAAEVELARVQGRPDVTASVRYTRRNSFFDEYFALSPSGIPAQPRDRDNILTFGVSIPLFTQRRNQGNVDVAVARDRAARLRGEHLETTIPLEVEAAYTRWSVAQRTQSLFQRGVVEQSEKNLTVIREAYTLGQLRVLDVLAEQRRLIETQLAFIDAQTELAQATAELERAVGGRL